jgi:prepilin-type N-terminal cleavage/methylation domain-containing protein
VEQSDKDKGFTLIELSIVLVIIGLIVGGVLVGRDLINAAAIRAQISQIEQFNTAANTFKIRYGYLPGDIPDNEAVGFGFDSDLSRNGDGIIDGRRALNTRYPQYQVSGETNLFWVDLGKSGLIGGNFIYNTNNNLNISGDSISQYLPHSKMGTDKYVYVWSGGSSVDSVTRINHDGKNYYALSAIPILRGYQAGGGYGGPLGKLNTIPVVDAYNIDQKTDDGLPNSGSVFAYYIVTSGGSTPFTTAATPASATTCYDNDNAAGATQKYSLNQNGGNGTNCALSFRFQ